MTDTDLGRAESLAVPLTERQCWAGFHWLMGCLESPYLPATMDSAYMAKLAQDAKNYARRYPTNGY